MTQAPITEEPVLTNCASYCTPHDTVPGVLAISQLFVSFHPDADHHPCAGEFGVDQYEVRLEVYDILECGAVTMPVASPQEDEGPIAYFLQLHVRTIDGLRYCAGDPETAWCVVFKMRLREELYAAARLLLDVIKCGECGDRSGCLSRTSIPFPCLNCLAETESALSCATKGCWNEKEVVPCPEAQLKPSLHSPSQPARHGPELALRPGSASRTLLTQNLAGLLSEYLPSSVRLPGVVEWVLCYTPKAHGISLATLYRNAALYERTLLLVQDSEAHVFGGFAPERWEPRPGRFYGSCEAFVFTFGCLGSTPELRAYPWTAQNCCFMYSDHEYLAMGGGDGQAAVEVRKDLLQGNSSPTVTFGNPTLAASAEFVVRDVEVWALKEIE